MSEKHKFTSPIAILMQKQWKAISIESKLDWTAQLEMVNELLIPALFLAWQKVVYTQFVLVMISCLI